MENNFPPKKVVNLSYLNELSKGNPLFVKEMIGIFLEDNNAEIQQLEKSILQQNYPGIKEMAHKMRSTIAFAGLNHLIENELCEVEHLANEQLDIKKIEGHFMKVKTICQEAALELRSELTRLN